MATLQKIRNQAALLLIVVGVALFAFIIGDFLTSGSSIFQQSRENIAVINGESLNYKEYESRILELEDVYKMQTGQTNLQDEMINQIRESVFQTIVREKLLDETAQKLGIAVSDKELFDMVNGENVHYMVQQMPFFQNPETGAFDRNVMMNFLRTIQQDDLSMYGAEAQEQIMSMKRYWLFWENNLKYTRLEEKIMNLTSSSMKANSLDAKAAFDARQTSVDFAYAFKPYSALPDSAYRVSKSAVLKRYKATKERFKQEPYRSAQYIVVDVTPSEDDNASVKADMDKVAEEFRTTSDVASVVGFKSDVPFVDCFVANSLLSETEKDFVETAAIGDAQGPYFEDNVWMMVRLLDKVKASDSVKVRQIYLQDVNGSAQHRADSLLQLIRKGADFEALAAEFSQDQSAASGGEMGWFREIDAINGMGKDFVTACFAAKKGQSFIVKSKHGLHVVQLMDKTAPVAKSKIAQLYMAVTPSSRTYSAAYNQLNRVIADNSEVESFVKAAQEAGYQVQNAPMIRVTDYTIGNVPQMRQAVRFVFNNKEGAISTVMENNANQFMVVAVTGIYDEEYKTMESVQSQLIRELINEQKAAAIMADLKTDAADIATIAQDNAMRSDTIRLVNFGTRRITGLGEEPALLSAVMQASSNEISKPVAGKNGVYVFNVISQIVAEAAYNEATEKSNLDMTTSYRIMYQLFDAMKNEAEIEDTRVRFY